MIDVLFWVTVITAILSVIFSLYSLFNTRKKFYREAKGRMVLSKNIDFEKEDVNVGKRQYIVISYNLDKGWTAKKKDNGYTSYKIMRKNNQIIISNLPKSVKAMDSQSSPIKIENVNE